MSEFAAASASGDTEKEPMPTMGFLDHLEELRKRIVYSIIAVAWASAFAGDIANESMTSCSSPSWTRSKPMGWRRNWCT